MRCLPSLVVALCLPLSAGLAATEPYGRHFLLPGATPVVALETPAAADDDETEARLRAQAEEAELQGGPYAPLLAETLGDLARLLDRRQDFDAAQALRERALHLVFLPVVRRRAATFYACALGSAPRVPSLAT